MKRLVAGFAFGLVGCASSHGTGPLAAPALMRHVARLSDPELEGRDAGTDGERKAAEYVTKELRRSGLTPTEQRVPYGGVKYGDGSRNLYVLLRGQSGAEVIVIGAHLDHLGTEHGVLYPGADDNASGVAVVLGIAHDLAARRAELGRSVLFVWFGAEERGMRGSEYFVEHPPVPLDRIVAMINVDMIGRPLLDQQPYRFLTHLLGIQGDAVGLVGARHYPRLRALADTEFQADGSEIVAAEDLPDAIGKEVERQTRGRGDSISFAARGVPALFFGDGESSDYHQPSDTIDKLDPALLERRARTLSRVVVSLSRAPRTDFAPSNETPAKRKPERGVYVPIGLSNGLSLHPGPAYFLGHELSIVHFSSESHLYIGGYTDAVYDFGSDTVRLSAGPEVGSGVFGIDAGYALELVGGQGAHHGAVIRPYLSLAFASLGARIGYFDGTGWLGELGLLLKYPLPLATKSLP